MYESSTFQNSFLYSTECSLAVFILTWGGAGVAPCVDALYQSYYGIKKQINVVKQHIRIFTVELFGQFCYVCIGEQVVTEYFLDTHRDVEMKKSHLVGYRQSIAERIGSRIFGVVV